MLPEVVMCFSMSFQPYQGRYLRVYNQATTLVREGYDVTLLAWDRECESPLFEDRDGIKIRRFRIKAGIGRGPYKNAWNVLRFNWHVIRYLLMQDYDIAHCYNLEVIATVLLAARLRRKKCVLDLCEPEYYALWDKKFRPLLRLVNVTELGLARFYDHVLVHNLFQVDKFKRKGIKHISQIGSYPNLCLLSNENETSVEKPKDRIVIGRIGTFYQNNGLEELIEAFQRLRMRQQGRNDPIDYRLFLAGRVWDSYGADFEMLVEPLSDHIEVHGPFNSTELRKMYQNVDISVIFVRKTKWFANITPTKLFDSMANGVPVVGNEIGEVKQIVEEGPCGLIIDETDPESIADAFETLARDLDKRREMGRTARRLATEKYSWQAYQKKFLDVYVALARS